MFNPANIETAEIHVPINYTRSALFNYQLAHINDKSEVYFGQ